jgi:ubiquinone/menaquinone biosynthesis C-methylase UbiE
LRRFFIGGLIYDGILEPPLKNIKKRVAHFVTRYDLYPVLDICCGSGVQCFRIFEKRNGSVYGLDLDRGMIQYAVSKYPSIPFMCADAAHVPLKDNCVSGAILSYALHDKPPEIRSQMLKEVRRVLRPEGRIVFVDFEPPWSKKSRMAMLYVYGIEKMAGRDHFKNGRQFLLEGGLRTFLRRNGLKEMDRHDVELAHTSIVVARFV